MQRSLFDGKLEFAIENPIRLIELFAGYGSQYLALKYLGVEVESYRVCEWAVKSIQAYKEAHFPDDNSNYSHNLTYEQVIEYLSNKQISMDYSKPMSYQQIKRLGEKKCRQIYNNIQAIHNTVDIKKTSGSDLEIIDKDKYTYIMTYSFPCQDLSKAGLGKGMARDSETRSSMLWEVERILDELKLSKSLPQVLVMENVPDVIGNKNMQFFAEWLNKLESLGYHCYWQVLNAKNYSIPQNRDRCFMVSLLGDYDFIFPKGAKLEKRLIDILEEDVDEKYYLKGKTLEKILKAIVSEIRDIKVGIDLCDSVSKTRDIANTIKARYDCGYEHYSPGPTGIIELTKNQSQGNRVYSANGISVSLTANGGGLGAKTGLYQVPRGNNKGGIKYSDTCPTITTSCFENNTMLLDNYRIRKLTPKECFRLMGVKDDDFERIRKNQTDTSLYHLAGDSIVVNVLMALFKKIINMEE